MNRNALPRSALHVTLISAAALAGLAAVASSFATARGVRAQAAPTSERVVFLARDAHGELGWREAEVDGYWSAWRARDASGYASVDAFAPREAPTDERATGPAAGRIEVDGIDTTGYVDRGGARWR